MDYPTTKTAKKKQQRNIKDNLDPILRKMLEKETSRPVLSCEKRRNLKTSRGKQKSKKTERIQGGRSGVNRQSTVVQVIEKKLNQQHQQCQRETDKQEGES
ncbi:uncharacterized protein LOC123525079 [Mercenaria mercenaria]|uniref:uncharacterized protein LOC123525079 n=1 Tax=Mercenaria mercenaria TaxID=6596 RepID=UPI00234F9D13|nr:uncharacterized protein LOC123525079 [Mercenaria mercenaria]